MSNSQLPERASLEYLKKLAKERLLELRRSDPRAKLATALLAVAHDHGFSSWRALKTEVERRQAGHAGLFFDACGKGDTGALRDLLATDPDLVRIGKPNAQYGGWSGLHSAAQGGHVDAVRLLLDRGADPNVREDGDNTCPLHWAAARRNMETVRVLLDAGGDVHGFGDVHELDTIGWATFFHEPGGAPGDRPEMAAYLVERGARHHIFSALSLGDMELIRTLVEQNPEALDRRMSRFEGGLTPLHFACKWKRYDLLDLLIDLGADLEAEDRNGHTAIEAAMLQGDREAMRRLHAAGAKSRQTPLPPDFRGRMAESGNSVLKIVPMIHVPDIAKTLDWYKSIGFEEVGRWADGGVVNWGMLSFGKAQLMLNVNGKAGEHDVSLWFYTDRIEEIYSLLESRQLGAAQAALAGQAREQEPIEFTEYLWKPPYGGREFGIRDLNGYNLFFLQED